MARIKIAPLIECLPAKTFEQHAFDKQKTSSLFAPEAAPVKAKLRDILEKSFSSENLDFLEEIHRLNASATVLSPVELQQALKDLDQKYIVKTSKTVLNIQSSYLDEILAKPYKSLIDYSKAITEIFSLIRNNVRDSKGELGKLESDILNKKNCNLFIEELNNLPKPAPKLPFPFNKLNSSKEDEIIRDCHNFCKAAQQDLITMSADKALTTDEFKSKFNKTSTEIINKLSESFRALIAAAPQKGSIVTPKAKQINALMNALNDVKVNIYREESSANRKRTDSRLAENSGTRSTSQPSLDETRRDSTSLSGNSATATTPVSTPRITKEPTTHYKPSSRAIPEEKSNDEPEKMFTRRR